MKLSEEEFDRIVKKTIRRIPLDIQGYLDNIAISVRRRPTEKMLKEMGVPPDAILFGVYQGVPLIDRSVTFPPLFPDTILLFQEPIEDICETKEQLQEQIEITVVHEIAHFFGITEERLKELGYG
jgi:predicted Zn-dependent protease with MMP-like domain